MNLRQRIGLKIAGVEPASTENHGASWDSLFNFLGISGKQEDLSEATYYACIKVLSEAVGKLPLKLQSYTETQGVRPLIEHPLYNIVRMRPNPYMTSSIFWSTTEFHRNHFGNAYIYIKGSGKEMTLWLLDPRKVKVVYDDARKLDTQRDVYYRLDTQDSKMRVYGSEEIIHLKTFNTLDGLVGKSVREQLAETVAAGGKSQKVINDLYDSGMTAKAVLQYTGDLNAENVDKLARGINAYMKGRKNGEGIENLIPIPLGMTLTPLNMKLADSQFLETKQFTAMQIASAFGVKPYQVGDYTKSSYASAEAQQLSFYVDTLLYILKQYEEEVTYKLLDKGDMLKGCHFKFNVASILRADMETQIRTLSTAVNSFLYTPNEARHFLDLEDKEGGDKLLGNGAAIPIELIGSQYQKGNEDGRD